MVFKPRTGSTDPSLIYGTRPVWEALEHQKPLDRILVAPGAKGPVVQDIRRMARQMDVVVINTPTEKLDRLVRGNHQGVVAFGAVVEYQPLDEILIAAFESGMPPLMLVLDRITDVRNNGAIARTAECAGAHGMIVPTRGGAMLNADAVKTSAGALNYLNIHRSDNLKIALNKMRESGLKIIAVTEHAQDPYYETDFSGPLALILGSEEEGISGEYLKLCDEKVCIPMEGKVGSLNVSVAAGIVLFEVLRQRNVPKV